MTEPIVIILIAESYQADSIGQRVPVYTERAVFGERGSVTRAEWSAAGEQGLKPEYRVDVFVGDYQGERIVRMEVNGSQQTFAVYRTYRTGDTVELYLEWKTGDSSYVHENPAPEEK